MHLQALWRWAAEKLTAPSRLTHSGASSAALTGGHEVLVCADDAAALAHANHLLAGMQHAFSMQRAGTDEYQGGEGLSTLARTGGRKIRLVERSRQAP